MRHHQSVLPILAAGMLLLFLASCSNQHSNEYDAATSSNENEEVERIVVTGSRMSLADQKAAGVALKRKQTKQRNEKPALSQAELIKLAQVPESSYQIFKRYGVNPTISSQDQALSTFSMDVDNGSYKLAANMLNNNRLPAQEGIRIEEFVNAMNYDYQHSQDVFSLSAEVFPSPFRHGYHVLHLGVQTQRLAEYERKASNIVLVADISGSMASDSKLELLKQSLKTLVSQLGPNDRVALVSYNEIAQVVLPSTSASYKRAINKAIDTLSSGGSTNVEAGLSLAYQQATEMFVPGLNNRVILTSDGMANTGATSPTAILQQIETHKEEGVFLTTIGVGHSMFNDYLLEQLANQGNGHYLYVANQGDIQASFVDGISRQLQTVAKDARVQVTFNPDQVSHYRLLGYENRQLNNVDFTNAAKDAGEIGAGHSVTVLYEVKLTSETNNSDLANVSIAYKKPLGQQLHYISKEIPKSVVRAIETTSSDSKLSLATAAFAEKLRQSYWSRIYPYQAITDLLETLPVRYQQTQQVIELASLIKRANQLDHRADPYIDDHPINTLNFDRVPLLD
ncbi:von Willebrand factor type A domain-containing protein [Endozoicomonas sp. G2_1]|uniref:vWA domain-containing protein n=1 Tax=Endozoicomonas sp. G2_1 TaxID=2821091 RepID=UPI001ADCF0F2|nr:von Willebrand factor type A domain-containing protein [Endozoicomonas sp. G2_1]MBO9491722.1 von Willebrand factor type A domain-containing protein [Endozoicomonas sp. G2_1]